MTFWEISEFHKLKEGLSATGCKSEEGRKSISMWDLILALRISSCISLGKLLHLSVGFSLLICPGRRLDLTGIHNLWV